MGQAVPDRLQAIISPAVDALGYELVGIEYLPQGRHSVLRVYIDSEDGITVDDCAKVSYQVSGALEVEDPIQGQFTLEVSSPGLDRPLFEAAHYERFVGQQVQIRLKVPLEGRRKYKGLLLGMRGDEVVIRGEDDEELAFPLGNIERAKLVPEW